MQIETLSERKAGGEREGRPSSEEFAREIRRIILKQSMRAHVGHIGSALSVADIVACLYDGVLNIERVPSSDRDRFVLSKGHAALALYAALALKGVIDRGDLDTFCGDESLLGVHPEHALPGVDFCTGSLGQGLSYGVGAALAGRMHGSSRRAFVLLSDAECNEGSTWESVMFAAHHHLANLTAIIDLNGQQALGYTSDVMNMSNMCDRWHAFGWDVTEVDGHDHEEMRNAIESSNLGKDQPHVIIARTTFGKGVSFMEGQIKWHYMPMNDEEFEQALAEVA